MCERNQLPLSWAVTPTVYTLKSMYRNRYYGKEAYLVPKGSQRVHSQSLDWKVSFTREGMRTDCLHFAGEREQIVSKIEAVAAL